MRFDLDSWHFVGSHRRLSRRRVAVMLGALAVTAAVASITLPADASLSTRDPSAASRSVPSELSRLRAQARRLYSPVARYDRALLSRPTGKFVTRVLNRLGRCEAPFHKRLTAAAARSRSKLDTLFLTDAVGMQRDEDEIARIRPQTARLAAALGHIKLANPLLRRFARAEAAIVNVARHAPRISACAFLHTIARDHFSLAKARHSKLGREVARFGRNLARAQRRIPPGFFTRAVDLFTTRRASSVLNLFHLAQLTAMFTGDFSLMATPID